MPIARPGFLTLARHRLLKVPVWLWAAFASVSLAFVAVPQIDLAVSRFFYTPEVGFETKGMWYERLMHASVGVSLVLGNIGLIVLWLFQGTASRRGIDFSGKKLLFLLVFLALGPGLIVNGLLKENWGRARPVDVIEFSGSKEFTPAFVLSDQDGKSFSSGHAAASFYWVVVALLIASRRKRWVYLALSYCLLVSWMRVAAGGHFLSDVVTSVFTMGILAFVMYGIVYPEKGSSPASCGGLGRAG